MATAERIDVSDGPTARRGCRPPEIEAIERERFLTGLAHDLLNAVTVIGGTAQLAERRMAAVPTRLESISTALRAVRDAAARMADQIAELDDFASLQPDQPPALVRGAVDLCALARAAVDRNAAAHAGHQFSMVEDAEGGPVVGQWDGRLLERALENLVGNAVRYSPAGGGVTVRVGRESAAAIGTPASTVAVLQVRDQGVGIPAHDLPHVFEWYRRAANAAETGAGRGIGLAVTHRIAEQHGGTVEAASELGHGSTFTLRLPLSA
jgi:signal transduction histidine kinase